MSAQIKDYFASWFDWIYLPQIGVLDIIEIIIIAVLVYAVLVWIKNTKAWMLLRGFVVLGIFILIAVLFRMSTILWLVRNGIGILAIAAVVVFQPELRRALDCSVSTAEKMSCASQTGHSAPLRQRLQRWRRKKPER